MPDFRYIRDEIVINDDLNARIAKQNVPPGSTIRLVARLVRHDEGFIWRMPGFHVAIVAGEYDNNGGSIDVSVPGTAGPGVSGPDGAPGNASSDGIGNRPGGAGGAGGQGRPGTAATSVRIFCELLRGGEVRLSANGGPGGNGGAGGDGGKGGDGHKGGPKIDPVEGTSGGNGGPGGPGGPGGSGGTVLIEHIRAVIFAPPVLEAGGGRGGAGGSGGRPGARGKQGDENGKAGPAGPVGPAGAAGAATLSEISSDAYAARVLAELGSSGAAEWATYRLTVGEHNYRAYNPEIPTSSDLLIRAMREFDATLRIDPANRDAARLQQQILLDQNILGLPNQLDLIPDFDKFISEFTAFGPLLFGTFNEGVQLMLHADVLDKMQEQLKLQRDAVEGTVTDTEEELHTAERALKDASDEVQEAQARVAAVKSQIEAAQEEMNHHSFDIAGLAGVVGEIATAVVAVVTALPSGGASLVVLVPDVIALVGSVTANAGPIVDALFAMEEPDLKAVTAAEQNVNKDISEVIKDTKTLVNFVNLVHKLAEGTTPDNAKSAALVQRGVELIHAQLLAEHRMVQADHTVTAVTAKRDRASALLAKTKDLIDREAADVAVVRGGGLSAVRHAQLHLDSLLGFAFRAQRSAEIYTLKSEARNLFLDAGYVPPDVERDFIENFLTPDELLTAYTESFAKLLQPIRMQDEYLNSFTDSNNLDDDSRRLSFTDPEILQNFRETHDLQFTITVNDLPALHHDAKIQGVFVAFVGATSASGVISCEVRHGNRYEQQRPDGTVTVQLLQPRTDAQLAHTTRLQLAGVSFQSAPPLTAPQSLSFFGRGVAGLWDVSIPQSEFDVDATDLTGLSEIQVFIGYQFLR